MDGISATSAKLGAPDGTPPSRGHPSCGNALGETRPQQPSARMALLGVLLVLFAEAAASSAPVIVDHPPSFFMFKSRASKHRFSSLLLREGERSRDEGGAEAGQKVREGGATQMAPACRMGLFGRLRRALTGSFTQQLNGCFGKRLKNGKPPTRVERTSSIVSLALLGYAASLQGRHLAGRAIATLEGASALGKLVHRLNFLPLCLIEIAWSTLGSTASTSMRASQALCVRATHHPCTRPHRITISGCSHCRIDAAFRVARAALHRLGFMRASASLSKACVPPPTHHTIDSCGTCPSLESKDSGFIWLDARH